MLTLLDSKLLHFYTLPFPLHTPHSTLYTTLYTPHYAIYTLHSLLYTLRSALYTSLSLHILHFTLRAPHFAIHSQSTVHWYVAREKCTRLCSYSSFSASVLRDCIPVRGFHLFFSQRSTIQGGQGGFRFSQASSVKAQRCRGRKWRGHFQAIPNVFQTIGT